MNFRKIFHYGSWAMVITGLVHLMGHFSSPGFETEEKIELARLMEVLKFDMDPWFTRSMNELFNAFSLYLTVMLLTLGLINILVYRSNASDELIKKLSLVNLLGMLAMVALSIVYAFSIPIVLFGIAALLMLFAFIKA